MVCPLDERRGVISPYKYGKPDQFDNDGCSVWSVLMSLDVKYLLLLIKKKSRRIVTTTKSDSFCSTKFSIHFYWQTCKVASAVVPLPYAIVYILLTLSQPEYSGYICRWRSSNQPAINQFFYIEFTENVLIFEY